MKIQSGDIIKHGTFMDVALMVTEVVYDLQETVVMAIWINQGMNATFIIENKPFQLTIHPDQHSVWFKCNNPEAKCIRWEQWTQFKGVI